MTNWNKETNMFIKSTLITAAAVVAFTACGGPSEVRVIEVPPTAPPVTTPPTTAAAPTTSPLRPTLPVARTDEQSVTDACWYIADNYSLSSLRADSFDAWCDSVFDTLVAMLDYSAAERDQICDEFYDMDDYEFASGMLVAGETWDAAVGFIDGLWAYCVNS